jgi:hypothetical protein
VLLLREIRTHEHEHSNFFFPENTHEAESATGFGWYGCGLTFFCFVIGFD